MKYISLFAGIGGFDLALNRLGHECVFVNEWDKYAAQTYEKNFGHKPDTTDIRLIRAYDIPDHDLLVGGFPCQSFSIAGKRGGFNDTRGTMFFEIARILKDKRPAYLLLENVKGLLSHDNGRTFETIMRTLDELGYECQWQVLNSKNYGVPQNRERVFIVGHLRGEPRPKVFPIGANSQADIVLPTLTARYWGGQANGGYIGNKEVNRIPLKFLQRNQRNIAGDYSFTIDGANTGGVQVSGAIRRLTPIECERLQGFPDNWTEGVSDTQRYKQLGNAVTVNVVYEIVKRMRR
jgi:DNA (cytosine-5)-methyltransferase 1